MIIDFQMELSTLGRTELGNTQFVDLRVAWLPALMILNHLVVQSSVPFFIYLVCCSIIFPIGYNDLKDTEIEVEAMLVSQTWLFSK